MFYLFIFYFYIFPTINFLFSYIYFSHVFLALLLYLVLIILNASNVNATMQRSNRVSRYLCCYCFVCFSLFVYFFFVCLFVCSCWEVVVWGGGCLSVCNLHDHLISTCTLHCLCFLFSFSFICLFISSFIHSRKVVIMYIYT